MRALRVAVVSAVLVTTVIRSVHHRKQRKRLGPTEDLRFRVPVGQDPAAVVAKLRVGGFRAGTDPSGGEEQVVITCHPARDRERVRQQISGATFTMEGDAATSESVVFVDEQPSTTD